MAVIEQDLDATFAALADPTRRAILARLAEGEATVNELAEPFDLALQTVSKHIKVLEHCGLISRGRHAQFRPCRLEPQALDRAVEWIERWRQIWTDRFDQLDRHLRDIRPDGTDRQPDGTDGRPDINDRPTNDNEGHTS
ncbi:MAG TPA: metalloregulator ArsR/SmtB family transcription factor [Acidimicrobiia bacterium]|jgi:DNA-binding transcriptional ArsR family regulator|nr:metalloregulator ArsR/SmtB family transcription factor [Acidimicrobiia bacterium]